MPFPSALLVPFAIVATNGWWAVRTPTARRDRAPAVQLLSDWMFVEARGAMPGASRELDAIVDPFGRSLLVGEAQWHRPTSPEALLVLDVALRNHSLLARIPSASCTGSQATVVRVVEVVNDGMPCVKMVGVGRCIVEGISSKRPRLRVRVRAKSDSLLEGSSLEDAQRTAESIQMLWERSVQLFQRIQGLKLEAKLRSLGSSSSAAMLAIPLEQQLELSKQASGDTGPQPRRLVEVGIDDALSTGVNFTFVVQEAKEQQLDDDLSIAPSSKWLGDNDILYLNGQLSLISFVALRLTRQTAEDVDDFLEDQAVPTSKQAEGVDVLSRLKLCERRLQSKFAEMQAQISLLSLQDPNM